MPYRTELKRPDLKGHFPCSVCQKVFCHSSSLSRHRMQAHFKSYTCTQCNQEIPSSETLRSHMMRIHQIARMFMCRCCNWAFPDKTSLHLHTTSLTKTGNPGDVPVLARSTVEGDFTPNLDYTPSTSPTGTRESESPSPLDEAKMTPQHSTPQLPTAAMSAQNPFLTNNNLLNVGIFPPAALSNRLDLIQKLKSKSNAKAETNGTPPMSNLNSQLEASPQLNNWIANWFANNPFQMPMADVYPNLLLQNEKAKLSPNLKSSTTGPTPPKKAHLDIKSDLKLLQNGNGNVEKKPSLSNEPTNGRHGNLVDSDAQSRLLSVIDNLFSAKTNMNTSANAGVSPKDRPNKRKARKPQQLSESFFSAISADEEQQASIKIDLGDANNEKKPESSLNEEQQPHSNPDQPSPAISDSHTSGSSAQLTDSSTVSPKKCLNCQVMKGKLEQTENRIQAFQKKVAELTEKIDLVEEQSRNQECLRCTQASTIEAEQKERIEQLAQKLDEIADLSFKAKELCDADDDVPIDELKNLFNLISEITSH